MRILQRGAALAAVTVAAAGALVGCNKGSANTNLGAGSSDANIATVNGTPISNEDFYITLQSYRPQSSTANQPAGRVKLRQLIEDAIVEQLAKKDNVYPTDAQVTEQLNNIRMVQELNSVQPFDQQLKAQGLTEDYLKRLQIIPQLCQLNLLAKGITVTDADVKAYYDRHKADMFTKPERAHIKRMVLASEADAKAVYAQLQKGASFEQLNAAHSMDKQLVDGEFTQWLPLDNPHTPEAKPLFNAIRETAVGQTTPPVQFQGTWWIVKVVEKKPKQVFDFNTAEPMVHMSMMQQKVAADPSRYTVLEQNLRNATMAADIDVEDPRYKQLVDDMKNPPIVPEPAASTAPPPSPTTVPANAPAPQPAAQQKVAR
jgi:parvulin-like peptidyl-prolyl isomerase